jgi:hypothetical protein
MGTMIRPEISVKNKYWIDKHRHYELKHFCLQYPRWKREYDICGVPTMSTSMLEKVPAGNIHGDPTAEHVLRKVYYQERIELVEKTALETDKYLYEYILKAVTENLSYNYLKSRLDIPCSRDMYYDRYRKFFWLLSEARK